MSTDTNRAEFIAQTWGAERPASMADRMAVYSRSLRRDRTAHVLCSRTKWRIQQRAPRYRLHAARRQKAVWVSWLVAEGRLRPQVVAALRVRPAVRP